MNKLYAAVAALLFGAALLTAAPVNVTLVDVGTTQVSDGSFYVGPYTLSVDGNLTAALCIDFLHEANVGDSWVADIQSLNAASLPVYAQEAVLYDEINKAGADRVAIQHAAWALTDPGYVADASAQAYVDLAVAGAGLIDLGRFQTVIATAPSNKQMFLVDAVPVTATPEPSTTFLAGLGITALGLIARKRWSNNQGV